MRSLHLTFPWQEAEVVTPRESRETFGTCQEVI